MATWPDSTTLNDLPDVIVSNIIAAVSDVRSRNAASLVCWKWRHLERSTRTSLTLRGNVRNLFRLPTCFHSVTHLDISLLSPWGHPLLSSFPSPPLIAQLLHQTFPRVTSLTLYARDELSVQLLASEWLLLKEIKLVRWHQRPQMGSGEELQPLFHQNMSLETVDLSRFYCYSDDIPAALSQHATTLTSINLLNPSIPEGFRANEIMGITKSCPNLRELRVACVFDHRYRGYVGDECLLAIPVNCPKLTVVHLADTSALVNSRADLEFDGYTAEDSRISVAALMEFFAGLPLLEEVGLDVCNNVRDSGPVFELLNVKCARLRSLRLGQFHGISVPVGSKLDGVALCQGLESLSIRNVGDLTDMGLIAIGRGCWKLRKFEIQGCKKVTMRGMRTLASLLKRTLVDVKISCCKYLNAAMSLKSLEPIQDRIERLHIDCIWNDVEEDDEFDVNDVEEGETSAQSDTFSDDSGSNGRKKRCRVSYDLNCCGTGIDNGVDSSISWEKLQCLSLWIGVGEDLSPLASVGLLECPNLEEIRIKVEGDCREWSKHDLYAFGLSSLVLYPRLSKMHLDCGDTIGYAHTAPSGQMDLSQWERFYLLDIQVLGLVELDYWPPQDRDVNQRSLSLPAAGLLRQCLHLRKLFIHGTAHEHFLGGFLVKIPALRDFQLRVDYYPAPETDMSTEMRADSLSRFEAELNGRQISD